MNLVSVTRLHLRGWRFFPPFLMYTLASTRQARRAPGFRGGWLGVDRAYGFWTATVWDSPDAMRGYRNTSPHLVAMRKLLQWCDEASYVHWEEDGASVPDSTTAWRRLADAGKLSKVLHPSPRQASGRTAVDSPPTVGQRLTPR